MVEHVNRTSRGRLPGQWVNVRDLLKPTAPASEALPSADLSTSRYEAPRCGWPPQSLRDTQHQLRDRPAYSNIGHFSLPANWRQRPAASAFTDLSRNLIFQPLAMTPHGHRLA